MDIQERVARRIHEIAADGSVTWRELTDDQKGYYLDHAKRIIRSVKISIKQKKLWEEL